MKYYMCYLTEASAPKNNLEKDLLEALRNRARKLIAFNEVAEYEQGLKAEVEQLNRKNKRSRPVEVSLRKHREDYYLFGFNCAVFSLLECEV